ncbi:MAG: ligand-binding sensor domain-containing protein [Bacteroidales bacterium]
MFRLVLVFLISVVCKGFSQNIEWNLINTQNTQIPNQTVKSMAVDSSGALWIGTYMGGIGVLKGDEWTIYHTSNSDLPHNYVNAIAIDRNNVKWIGTDGGGLAKFDGTSWEIFKTNNSGLPSNVVMSVFCDPDGTVWAGTYFGGIARFNGTNWTIYNDENSPLLSNKIVCIAKDHNNQYWFGTQGSGIASFDGVNWNVYTERNSKLSNDYIYSIAVDSENKKWIGTGGGGVNVFNDVYWINYQTSNSRLTDDNIRPIAIDAGHNKWVGTYLGGVNLFNGTEWIIYDFHNSPIPDDEITTMLYHNNQLYIGTERSGIIQLSETSPLIAEASHEKLEKSIPAEDQSEVSSPVEIPVIEKEKDLQEKAITQKQNLLTNQILLMLDAADIHIDRKKSKNAMKAFSFILNNREKIDETYEVKLLVYSSNFDVNPKKINLNASIQESIHLKEIIYMEGEHTFSEALKKGYEIIKQDYRIDKNNHLMAVTFKFIRDNETAKVIIKDHLDNNKVIFTGIAFGSESWKLRTKMKNMVPAGKGKGHYYEINKPGFKDNWTLSGHLGMSMFRGDIDVNHFIAFPGIAGITAGKQVFSDGNFKGFTIAQFNVGKLKGKKNLESFENKFVEVSVAFQGTINKLPFSEFRFNKIKPYASAGIGIISYRALLRDELGNVVNGFGYHLTDGQPEMNPPDPQKDKPLKEFIFPLEIGAKYELNRDIDLTFKASSRYINSDKLDAKIRLRDDKYWLFSFGFTYKLRSKKFMADVLKG